MDDATLVSRVLAGDKTAFEPLVDRHRAAVMRLASRLLGDQAECEDVRQEAFLQAFLGLRYLRAPEHFGSWLLGIVINLCRMRWRTQRNGDLRQTSAPQVPLVSPWTGTEPSAETVYALQQRHRAVLAAITTLSVEQRHAVRLHYFDGLPLWEIGLLAGLPVGTVKSHLHRAKARLRQQLMQEFGETPPQRTREEDS